MQRSKFALLLFSLFFCSYALTAQTTAKSGNQLISKVDALSESIADNWSFYTDEENQVYYIDFETINVNLSDIIVRDAQGEILMKEDVLDLPVNTIYEIDFSPYGIGQYTIELRSFTGMMMKEVTIP
ncbi:MAG: hypothetical protein AAFP19_05310 [Bacteroidota bacterium]